MNYDFLQDLLTFTDFIAFIFFMCSVGYLFIFAIFSLKNKKGTFKKTKKNYRYLVVFTSNKFDENIQKSVKSFLNQNFSKSNYDIVLISRNVTKANESAFDGLPVTLIKCNEPGHFRGQMLETVLSKTESSYDVIVVMKRGDTVEANFLDEINKAYHSGGMAIQTHHMLKDPKTNTAILNALSKEINNSIFRKGHVNLGFSAGLIGSGMAFDYSWFKENITKVKQKGLTKQLETILLKQGVFIEYLEDVYTFDEKIRYPSDFYEERQHWYSSNIYSLTNALKDFPKAVLAGNFDFCDKIIQWILPSRFLLIFVIAVVAVTLLFVRWYLSIKWFGLLFLLFLTFDLSIPHKYHNTRFFFAIIALPSLFISTLMNSIGIGNKK